MDTENNFYLQIRIAVAYVLATTGAAFISRLPQLLPGQESVAWYQSGFFGAGIAVVIVALLVLIISPKGWSKIWRSILSSPIFLYHTFVWRIYKPEYVINELNFIIEISEKAKDFYEAKITASTNVWIKAKRCPIKVDLISIRACLEQEVGWEKRKTQFPLNIQQVGNPQLTLQPGEDCHIEIIGDLPCNGKLESFPTPQKNYRSGVWGIYVSLPKGVTREIYKGIKCKPMGAFPLLV